MRILLLQDAVYLPTFGGGNKGNRMLLEQLARNRHTCLAVSPAFTTRAGPGNEQELLEETRSRGIRIRRRESFRYAYDYRGVEVDAVALPDPSDRRNFILRRIEEFRPDWVLVSDDRPKIMLEAALTAAANRTVILVHTNMHLPFGPMATRSDERQTRLFSRARAIFVLSRFCQNYVSEHSGMKSIVVPLPVYGDGPFKLFARHDRGFVTMINPCVEKGLSIFLGLAHTFAAIPFAAVPTWGADQSVMSALGETANVTVLPASDDLDTVLSQTRVLIVPSLIHETFGYVAVDAMLRGIPVLASDIGGLPEAKLGVDYLLPVIPAERRNGVYIVNPQDLAPWSDALAHLLRNREAYETCSQQSRSAALHFVSTVNVTNFENLLNRLDDVTTEQEPVRGTAEYGS